MSNIVRMLFMGYCILKNGKDKYVFLWKIILVYLGWGTKSPNPMVVSVTKEK